MEKKYFKHRKYFDFSPHPYDIGNPIGFWHKYEDNHFLNKIYAISDDYYKDFFEYHLAHAIDMNVCSSENFFIKVWEIVEDRIKRLREENPFSSYRDRYLFRIEKLKKFQKYLQGIDKWNARPAYIVIGEKDIIIQKQKEEIEKLKASFAELYTYEVAQKVWIEDGHLPTLIDLFQQIIKLELPSGRKLLRSDYKSPYSKMISKYFSHSGKDIPVETARNYFVEKKGDIASKGTTIQQEHQLFKIVPIKEDPE